MKHETFNSIIAALGLLIGAVNSWYQFVPGSDHIELVSEGRVNLGRALEVEAAGLSPLYGGAPMAAAGPITWKVRVYNASDRPVSIVSFSVFLLSKNGDKIYFSEMRERLSPYDTSYAEQKIPDNLGARETKAYLLSMYMPFKVDQGDGPKCEHEARQLSDLERCFFFKKRDLFGNPVTVTRFGADPNGPISVSWDDGNFGPRYALVLETADGSEFETHLSYFPEF